MELASIPPRHKWVKSEWPDRERICAKCAMRARRYGIGRDSYWGFLRTGEETEEFSQRIPPCGG